MIERNCSMKTNLISMAIIIALCVAVVLIFKANNSPVQEPAEQQDVLQQDTSGFASAKDLAQEFIEICAKKDVQAMYGLYYDDMLTKSYERTSANISKENFDFLLGEEMGAITSYELFEYGGTEMPNTVSPLYYVDYFHYSGTHEETGLSEKAVTSCATLRVYNDPDTYSDHMLACIDGAWYITD